MAGNRSDDLPADLDTVTAHLRILNCSCNPLRLLRPDAAFPALLEELHLSGCSLDALPPSIARLCKLKKIFAGANRLSNVDALFKLPSLVHAGLSYNAIAALPPPRQLAACTSLLSLDISHNAVEDLPGALAAIAALPSLQVLSVQGNPVVLLPHYNASLGALSCKMGLSFLNGQKQDTTIGAATAAQGSPVKANTTQLKLELRALVLMEDPFAGLRATWAEELAAAQAAGVPPDFTAPLLPPLQPYVYHVELDGLDTDACREGEGSAQGSEAVPGGQHGQEQQQQQQQEVEGEGAVCPARSTGSLPQGVHEGGGGDTGKGSHAGLHKEVGGCAAGQQGRPAYTRIASVPLVLHPPEPPAQEHDVGKGGKAGAARAARPPPKAGPKGGRVGKDQVQEGDAAKLDRGQLQVVFTAAASVATRDWLRNGVPIKLFRTRLEAVKTPEAIQQEEQELKEQQELARTRAAKGKGRPNSPDKHRAAKEKDKDAAERPAVDMSKYAIVPHTTLLGLGVVRAGVQLVHGSVCTVTEALTFTPPPALWDPTRGMRLALCDPRHSTQPVAHMEARLVLHAPEEEMPVPIAAPPAGPLAGTRGKSPNLKAKVVVGKGR